LYTFPPAVLLLPFPFLPLIQFFIKPTILAAGRSANLSNPKLNTMLTNTIRSNSKRNWSDKEIISKMREMEWVGEIRTNVENAVRPMRQMTRDAE
jgi:hypothetical protein